MKRASVKWFFCSLKYFIRRHMLAPLDKRQGLEVSSTVNQAAIRGSKPPFFIIRPEDTRSTIVNKAKASQQSLPEYLLTYLKSPDA